MSKTDNREGAALHVHEEDPRLLFQPTAEATVPPAHPFLEHLYARWWAVHPIKGLVWWDSVSGVKPRKPNIMKAYPQCNSGKEAAETALRRFPWARIEYFQSVFRPINPQDWSNS
jgi:hypothetical protein